MVIDQSSELVRDRGADFAHVIESVELSGQALEHLQMSDRANAGAGDRCRVRPLVGRVVEEDDQILAARLGGHHRGLRAGDQLTRVGGVLRPLGHADRDRDLSDGAEFELRQAFRQPFREPDGVDCAA